MMPRPPRSTRSVTLFPDTTLLRSKALQFLTLPRVSRGSTPSPPSWPYRSARVSVLVSRERGTRTPLRALTEAPTPPAPSMRSASLDIVRIILAILLPPVGVFLQVGLGLPFWLNILQIGRAPV